MAGPTLNKVLLFLLFIRFQSTASFHTNTCHRTLHQRYNEDLSFKICLPLKSMADSNGELEDDFSGMNNNENFSPEKSRMNKFIDQFLDRTREQEGQQINDKIGVSLDVDGSDLEISESKILESSTHLVAIPMESCHELLLELESVQRAILYHCPILTDACIPGSMTRLPLLYVQAENYNPATVTSALKRIVEKLIQKHMFTKVSPDDEEFADVEEDLNSDGIRPVAITFQSLEIDGSNNNVLSTVGMADSDGAKKLQSFVHELQKEIRGMGWKTAFPLDPHETAKKSVGGFRPRVSFMELPKQFDINLSHLKDADTEVKDEDMKYLTSDEGGNGISPIFWCQWWDDVFGKNIRLREVGIYPRTNGGILVDDTDLSYSLFYLPYETISLPDGNLEMTKNEQKFQKYQDERLIEQQRQLFNEDESQRGKPYEEPDILMKKTRQRLENIYLNSAADDSIMLGDGEAEERNPDTSTLSDSSATEDINDVDEDEGKIEIKPVTASPDDYIDDWMKERISKVVGSLQSIKNRNPEKKEVPPIEENPIFKAYKEGTLVPKSEKPKENKKELGPYPNREYFFGIWKVLTSPTGFPSEEPGDDKCENLILRVDGTTAGGPILDHETKQKASGGTWKMIVDDDGDVKLRIRLIIPPKKERVLEMIGSVQRFGAGSVPMASRAFGIPHLEEKAKQSSKAMENMIDCSGEVSVPVSSS